MVSNILERLATVLNQWGKESVRRISSGGIAIGAIGVVYWLLTLLLKPLITASSQDTSNYFSDIYRQTGFLFDSEIALLTGLLGLLLCGASIWMNRIVD